MPTINFTINLDQQLNHLSPTGAFAVADNLGQTRSVWLPNQLLNNHNLKHGDSFTATGYEAVYMRKLIDAGILTFVSYEYATVVIPPNSYTGGTLRIGFTGSADAGYNPGVYAGSGETCYGQKGISKRWVADRVYVFIS